MREKREPEPDTMQDVLCSQSLFDFDTIGSLPNVQAIDKEVALLMIGRTLGHYRVG